MRAYRNRCHRHDRPDAVGRDDGYTPGAGGRVSYPAVANGVIAAGGTSVSLSNGQWQQRAWSGAGSGCSSYLTQPPAQRTNAVLTSACANRALSTHAASLRTRTAWRGKRLTFTVTVAAPYYDAVVYRSGNAVRIR